MQPFELAQLWSIVLHNWPRRQPHYEKLSTRAAVPVWMQKHDNWVSALPILVFLTGVYANLHPGTHVQIWPFPITL